MNNTNNISNIERVVMKRVYRMRVLRALLSNTVLAAVAATAALWAIGREVWVARVFSNGPQDATGRTVYLFYAFLHTTFVVEVLSLVALAALIILARETARSLSGAILRLTYATN